MARGGTVTVPEPVAGERVVDVRFDLDRASSRPVVLVVRTEAGTAGVDDFTPVERRLTVAPGARSAVLAVAIRADAVDEAAESFTVTVLRARGARAGPPARVTITAPG